MQQLFNDNKTHFIKTLTRPKTMRAAGPCDAGAVQKDLEVARLF